MADDQDDDAPQADGTVESAAAAIAELMQQKPPEDDGEESPAAVKPPVDEAADKSKDPDPAALEAVRKAQEAEMARAQYTAAFQHLVPQLAAAIAGEFGDIRGPADVAELQLKDPARFTRLVQAQARLSEAQRQHVQLQVQEHRAAEARQAQWNAGEQKKISELLPELRDSGTGPALAQKIGRFAAKAGYTPQQLASASATDLAMLHRAMRFEELEGGQAQARAKAAHAPRVSEPGTRSAGSGKGGEIEGDFARLKKSGSTSDAAAVFRNILK